MRILLASISKITENISVKAHHLHVTTQIFLRHEAKLCGSEITSIRALRLNQDLIILRHLPHGRKHKG